MKEYSERPRLWRFLMVLAAILFRYFNVHCDDCRVEGPCLIVSNLDGSYTIDVPANGSLVFSSIGYKTLTVPVDGRTKIDAVLQNDNELLDEAVAVGYGHQRKITMTGSVTSATGGELAKSLSMNL